MGRKASRRHAFVVIYQLPFRSEEVLSDIIENYLGDLKDINEEDRTFINTLVQGTKEHLKEIDALISEKAMGWTFDRIASIDLAIMRLAIFELKFMDDVPVNVSINEAVELAKVYGGDESPSFINGILGQVAKIQPKEV